MHHFSCLSVDIDYRNENIYFIWLTAMKISLSPVMYHFLDFDYIMRPIPLDLFEVKWLNSHIFMSYVDEGLS